VTTPPATGNLIIETSRADPDAVFYAAKWRSRDNGRQIKRRLGRAWLEPDGAGGWRRRRGRVADGYLDERRAYVELANAIESEDALVAERAEAEARRQRARLTFRGLANAWLEHAEHIKRVKPSTLRDYRSVLAEPGTPHRRGSGRLKGRVMKALGDLPATEVTVADVDHYLSDLAAEGVATRTVNRHREVLRSIFNFGCSAASGFGLTSNPAAQSQLRRVDGPRPLEIFSVEQIEELARIAASGTWRAAPDWNITDDTRERYVEEDHQLAELLRVACYTGLRRGELVALRWSDVRWTERVLVVERAISDGVEVSPKSRRARYVPLADQALTALERLSRRPNFVSPDDYIFASAVGDRLDATAVRRRYVRVRDTAGLPPLRFHDLRHSAGSLLARAIDPASVKDILGHADLKTTERYLHGQRASALADVATKAFTPTTSNGEDERRSLMRQALGELSADELSELLGAARRLGVAVAASPARTASPV
jgi:integrase